MQERDEVFVPYEGKHFHGIVEAIHANENLDVRIDHPGSKVHGRVMTFAPVQVQTEAPAEDLHPDDSIAKLDTVGAQADIDAIAGLKIRAQADADAIAALRAKAEAEEEIIANLHDGAQADSETIATLRTQSEADAKAIADAKPAVPEAPAADTGAASA